MAAQAGTQAVDRATSLLAVVVRSVHPRSFTSLVTELGLPKSTTSRLLQALERNELVRRDTHGNFRAGPLFTAYVARRVDDTELLDLARPVLDRIAEQTGETVNLAVADDDAVVQIAQADGRYLLGATNWVGVDVPPHCTAVGKVFYAYGVLPLPRGPLLRRTAATVVSAAELGRQIAEVSRRGWAVARDELETGLVAVAVPVFAGGSVVAAISVSGPTPRLRRGSVPRVAALLLTETQLLSQLLVPRTGKEGVA